MNDTFEYIEAYFENQLIDLEKRQFEERCVQDKVFAREVAFYISLREAARQQLLEQKKELWSYTDEQSGQKISRPLQKKMTIQTWLAYVAAACLIFFIAGYFLLSPAKSKQFADSYVKEHLTQLSQTMDASADSMQQGIAAFNNKDFKTALQFFQAVHQAHPANSDAEKNIGIVYLVTKEYDKALQQFEQLAGRKGLYSNPGLFLTAVTLLERNNKDDKAKAREALQRVVNEKAEGSREAEQWLKQW